MSFREKQQIIICVALGMMVGVAVLFRYLPLRKRIKAAEQVKAAQALAVTKALEQNKQLPALKEQLLHLQLAVGNYEANIPAQRALGAFLQQITNLLNKHNLKEQLIRPGTEIEADELNCIQVDIQCKGKLAQIFEFYKSLQSLERLIRIEQVKLENDRDFSGEVSMKTKAVIYYRPEQAKS